MPRLILCLLIPALLLAACSNLHPSSERTAASDHPQRQGHPASPLTHSPPAEGGLILWLAGNAQAESEDQARERATGNALEQLANFLETDLGALQEDSLNEQPSARVLVEPGDEGFTAYALLRLPDHLHSQTDQQRQQLAQDRLRAQQALQVQRLGQLSGEELERVYAKVHGRASVVVNNAEPLAQAQQRARRIASHRAGVLLREELDYQRVRAFRASQGDLSVRSDLAVSGDDIEQQVVLEQYWIEDNAVHGTVTLFGSGALE